MGLEDFSRGKKIFVTILTLVGAALFTVTGAMMAGVDSCSSDARANLSSKGSIDGNDVANSLFMARKRLVEYYPSPQVPVLPSSENEDELVKSGMIEGEIRAPLFDMWPRKHDAHVWAFAAAAKKAEVAGIVRPTPHEANVFYFNTLLGGRERIRWGQELSDYHDSQLGLETETFLKALGEFMMIHRYVESIDVNYQPNPNDTVKFYRERVPLMKAMIGSVNVKDFVAEATRLYDQRNAADQVTETAARLAGSAAANGYSPREAIDMVPNDLEKRQLQLERRVEFELIRADYSEIANALESSLSEALKREFYENRKGSIFRTSALDQSDERLDARLASVKAKFASLPEGWKDADEREKMKTFYHFAEREDEVRALLARSLAVQLGGIAMNDLKKDFDKEIKDMTTRLRVEAEEDNKVAERYEPSLALMRALENSLGKLRREPVTALVRALDTQENTSLAEGMARNRLVRDLKNALTSASGGSAAYSQIKALGEVINIEQLEFHLKGLEQELVEVQAEIAKRKDMPEYKDTWEFMLKDKAVAFRIEGKKLEIEHAKKMATRIEKLTKSMDSWLSDLYLQINAFEAEGTSEATIIAYMEAQLAAYPARIEAMLKDFDVKALIDELEGESSAATVVPQRSITLADYYAQKRAIKNFRERVTEPFEFPWIGLDASGKPLSVTLTFDSLPAPKTMREIKELGQEWNWIANLSAASSFVNSVSATPGEISEVIDRPGVGLYLFRITSSVPEMRYAVVEAAKIEKIDANVSERARELAIGRLARELARHHADALRKAAVATDDFASNLKGLETAGKLALRETNWFAPYARMSDDLSIVKEPARSDGSQATTINPSDAPSTPFFQVLTELTREEPVSALFFEAALQNDELQTLSDERYSFAWVSARKVDETALPSNSRDLNSSYTPQIISQTMKLTDARLIELMSIEKLLKGHKVEYYPADYKEPEDRGDDEE